MFISPYILRYFVLKSYNCNTFLLIFLLLQYPSNKPSCITTFSAPSLFFYLPFSLPLQLDLEACVWLEDYLATYKKILIVISHSQDFLNGVCTDMMVMQQQKLRYWSGNYDSYLSTRAEQDTNLIKLYKKQQVEINEIKQFISSCGTYANLVRQAKSRQKILDKMEADGLLEMPFEGPYARLFAFLFQIHVFFSCFFHVFFVHSSFLMLPSFIRQQHIFYCLFFFKYFYSFILPSSHF